MHFIHLKTQEQFDQITKSDIVLVKWKEGSTERKRGNEAASYKNCFIVKHLNELIVQSSKNIYLNIDMYLAGTSTAEEVYVVKVK